METTITPFLQSTKELILRSFPHGIETELYFPLLTILEPELSDRNLASVISNLTGKDYF